MDSEDGLVREFVEESLDHAAAAERGLLNLECDAGGTFDVDEVNNIFRAVHSVKGAASFFGLQTIERLAHRMENLLNDIRSGVRLPTSPLVDALLLGTDSLSKLLQDVAGSNDADISVPLAALDRAENGGPDETSAVSTLDEVSGSQASDAGGKKPESLHDDQPAAPGATESPAASVNRDAGARSPERKPSANSGAKASDASVRVSVGTLDCLMTLAGELVLGRNQLVQTIDAEKNARLHAVGARIDRVTSELQEAIMQTRMQPIGNVFGRFPRVVRDLSKKLGKRCELTISGEDVELDKTIVEGIADPLTHLVRNAVDHGLETPERRTAAGKSESGTVRLSAFHEAGKVVIAISDDGAGIDAAKLRQKAVAKGVISESQAAAMSDGEAVRLIFHPGFSTAEVVTDVSGRGVGMDVVRSNIEALGGWVDVLTEVGQGTTIRIALPLTLAIVPSLLVRAEGDIFAIPQANIVELVRLRPDDVAGRVDSLKGCESLRLRGELLPIIRLSEALGFRDRETRDAQGCRNIVVVESGKHRYGVAVDGLQDSEEIVVKPLGRHLKECRSLAGATVLGDGQVALILDAAGLAALANLRSADDSSSAARSDAAAEATEETQSLLLFANDPSERFAIHRGVIARIERAPATAIEEVSGREMLHLRGASLPLISLERHLNVKARREASRLFIVVFKTGGREIGLAVPQILDIRETTTPADAVTLREPGIMGSLTIDGCTVRIVDAFELARKAFPDYFRSEPKAELRRETPYRVLLAEDSNFFRSHVAGFLRENGFEVVECVDGQHGWETLRAGEEFDLVVTDVEMPRMDGLEFCRRIKSDPSFDGLKVIALTSLAGEEDVRRGREHGVDSYQVKLDRETLLATVKQFLGKNFAPTTRNRLQESLA